MFGEKAHAMAPAARIRTSRHKSLAAGFEVLRMIRPGHCLTCKPQVKDEIWLVNRLFDVFAAAEAMTKRVNCT